MKFRFFEPLNLVICSRSLVTSVVGSVDKRAARNCHTYNFLKFFRNTELEVFTFLFTLIYEKIIFFFFHYSDFLFFCNTDKLSLNMIHKGGLITENCEITTLLGEIDEFLA